MTSAARAESGPHRLRAVFGVFDPCGPIAVRGGIPRAGSCYGHATERDR